jgi:hypothetical protein
MAEEQNNQNIDKAFPEPPKSGEKSPFPTVEQEINDLYREILSFAQKTFDCLVRIGGLLVRKRAELHLDHGQWLPWIKNNLPFGEDAAQRYIRFYEHRDELPRDKVKTVTQALRLLKRSNGAMAGRKSAIDRSVKRVGKEPEKRRLQAEKDEE